MSGPLFVATDVGCIGGSMPNHTGVAINGFSGSAVLSVEPRLDHVVFELLIAGRLKAKEKVCAIQRTRADKPPRPAKYKAVCSKVKP